MKVSELGAVAVRHRLLRGEFCLDLHPFIVCVRSDIPRLAAEIALIYADFPLLDPGGFADFHVEVSFEKGLRRWFRPLARFYFDGRPSFIPLPAGQAFPMLEWGINWCVAAHAHQYLIVHAAVIERHGRAVILPAPPGSGKSTLCAALIQRGWRLLSDELALYDFSSGLLYGMARPVNLKNRSIDILGQYAPQAVFSEPVADTTKGTVALMKPPADSVLRVGEPALPACVVVPVYESGAAPCLEAFDRARALLLMADQSFNYHVHGRTGFDALAGMLEGCACHRFTYSRLADAERVFDTLLAAPES